MNTKTKKILSLVLSVFLMTVFILPNLILAEGPNEGSGEGAMEGGAGGGSTKTTITIVNPFKANTIPEFIKSVVNDILMPIGGVIAVLMIMYAGFLYVTARGNSAQITKAHDALLYAAIGAAVLLGAWVLSSAIEKTVSQLKVS